jgi:predicted porin
LRNPLSLNLEQRKHPMKKISAFLLATVAATPWASAQSSATVYGLIDMGLGYYSSANGSIKRVDSGQDTPSRIGFKGVEDLGDGFKAIYQLESGISVDTGSANSTAFWSRESYVGLSGSYGRLTLGRLWNPGDGLSWDVYKFNNFAAYIFPEFGNFDRLYNNSVRYTAPTFGGFSAEVLYSFGESAVSSSANSATEIGLSYKTGGFTGNLVANATKNPDGTATDKLLNLSASYEIAKFKLRAGYLDSRPDGSALPRAKLYLLGFDYSPTELFTAMADYQKRSSAEDDHGTDIVRLMGYYYMSKRSSMYVALARLSNKGIDTQSFTAAVAPGGHQTGINAGFIHSF